MADKANIVIVAVNTVTVAAVDVGYTKAPLNYQCNTTFFDATNQQSFGTVKSKMTGRTVLFSTTLQEMKLDNIRIASGLPTSALVSNQLTVANTELGAVAVVFTGLSGSGGDGKIRTVTVDAGVFKTSGDMKLMDKDADAEIPFSVDANFNTSPARYCLFADA